MAFNPTCVYAMTSSDLKKWNELTNILGDYCADEIGGEWDSVWYRIFLALRGDSGEAIQREFDGMEGHIYILAYDLGLAQGVCGENSMAGVGIRKGLTDAIRVSSITPSPHLLDMAIERGMKHGISIVERIRAETFMSNLAGNLPTLHTEKLKRVIDTARDHDA
ncbi:hypothetical protein [Burkholderia sp. AW49-1]